jgi:hypothetical protein
MFGVKCHFKKRLNKTLCKFSKICHHKHLKKLHLTWLTSSHLRISRSSHYADTVVKKLPRFCSILTKYLHNTGHFLMCCYWWSLGFLKIYPFLNSCRVNMFIATMKNLAFESILNRKIPDLILTSIFSRIYFKIIKFVCAYALKVFCTFTGRQLQMFWQTIVPPFP